MSALSAGVRRSLQAISAPATGSAAIEGVVWSPVALQTTTPLAAHCGAPRLFTRPAYTSALAPRRSSHATIAPLAPSGQSRGLVWSPAALHSATPLAVHCAAPAALMRCT